ncbi:hypothetical protein MNBD_PLANCTO03-2152, partial [hydrothermal vent metagenome]
MLHHYVLDADAELAKRRIGIFRAPPIRHFGCLRSLSVGV